MINGVPLIGLSLSFCVSELIEGHISVYDVDQIVTSTRARTEKEWEDVIQDYSRWYWRHDPAKARWLVRRLRQLGKIQQPRLEDDDHHPNIGCKYFAPTWSEFRVWVTQSWQIHWQDSVVSGQGWQHYGFNENCPSCQEYIKY